MCFLCLKKKRKGKPNIFFLFFLLSMFLRIENVNKQALKVCLFTVFENCFIFLKKKEYKNTFRFFFVLNKENTKLKKREMFSEDVQKLFLGTVFKKRNQTGPKIRGKKQKRAVHHLSHEFL